MSTDNPCLVSGDLGNLTNKHEKQVDKLTEIDKRLVVAETNIINLTAQNTNNTNKLDTLNNKVIYILGGVAVIVMLLQFVPLLLP